MLININGVFYSTFYIPVEYYNLDTPDFVAMAFYAALVLASSVRLITVYSFIIAVFLDAGLPNNSPNT